MLPTSLYGTLHTSEDMSMLCAKRAYVWLPLKTEGSVRSEKCFFRGNVGLFSLSSRARAPSTSLEGFPYKGFAGECYVTFLWVLQQCCYDNVDKIDSR